MYDGVFVPSERDRLLDEYAREYHERCDAYDAKVCSGRSPRTGEPVPVGADEFGLINRHALGVLNDLERRGPFSRAELRRAISHAS